MSFMRPFLRSFLICLFLLVLQFLSLYRKDLFGKGLDADVIFSIFFFASVSLVALALPVSVLLASLFTTGTFGEQYEMAAMRAGGMSTSKILRPMIVMSVLIALVSFSLSSYIIPVSNLKLYSLLYDVKQLKPTFSLEPGHFNSAIDNYVIRIKDKDIDKEMLYGILIYDHTGGRGQDRVLMADSGFMKVDPYGTYMSMYLAHGVSYETTTKNLNRATEMETLVRTYFAGLYFHFDISGFDLERTAEEDFSTHHYMLKLTELGASMDSISLLKDTLMMVYAGGVVQRTGMDSSFLDIRDSTETIPPGNLLLTFPKKRRLKILQNAIYKSQVLQSFTSKASEQLEYESRSYREFQIEFHAKFSLPIACILFLFIGAPLGAVVRKGGVGLPIVVSLVFYLTYYVVMIQGKKMATEGVLPVWMGVWLPVIVMSPLAFLFTIQATSSRNLSFAQFFFWLSNSLQDLLVFLLRPIFKLFSKKKSIPEMGGMPDLDNMDVEEKKRYLASLGIDPASVKVGVGLSVFDDEGDLGEIKHRQDESE